MWPGRFKSPVIQDDEHVLTVLRYIEANPLRVKLVQGADEYAWSSYRCHGLGEANELVDPLVTYEELPPYAGVRQRKWAEKVHAPLDGAAEAAVRRSVQTGLPYGEPVWVERLAKRLGVDLITRPRGRPRKAADE